MSRTTRLFDLLHVLRRHRRPVSGAVLAEELGISLRTLYRDIAALQSIGAEVEGEPGLGYVLKPNFTLPPLMFSDEEIEALALGLKWVAKRGDDGLAVAAKDAMTKIAAVLPHNLRQELEDSSLIVGPHWENPPPVDLALLRQAIREARILEVEYRDRQGLYSKRAIWPIALGYFESSRIVLGWCELRQDFRQFRIDRMVSVKAAERRYPGGRRRLLRQWRLSLQPGPDSTRPYTFPLATKWKEKLVDQEIVFYTNPWSRAAIVHWMLEELQVPYRMEILDYGAGMKTADYLAINPMGKVPAIKHGDVIVTEAAAICAYLADTFPEAGLAPEPAARGEYYRWLFLVPAPWITP
ncbi:HTH domain-containing protein [Alkalilimnicola ehrlichii]|uniref:GST N-terminal domain-containing protein n=1 Tax=Alkalilimnicola ehrlichii TaxID=351052 RepID=A0A3E0X1S3_9GAMM|nr:HTH domain-containing protein [Alkalilimnicola ehrlichii]RFA38676.1 hypothetical protein CAL65_04935 [Alkalilimnicola ehrlichii]